VGFGSKERPRNRIFGVLSVQKMGREPKKKRKRGVGEGKEMIFFLPFFLPLPLPPLLLAPFFRL